MAADEQVHEEVVRGLATGGRNRMSGTFRAAVFGANDGLVSNLALVAGIGASGAAHSTLLLTGFAGLLAGAMSMAAGEYVSVRSQLELLQASTPNPLTQNALPHLNASINELDLVYRARGMGAEEAAAHARKVRDSAIAGVTTPEEQVNGHETIGTAKGAAASSFCFFASGAMIPVLPYVFGLDGLAAIMVASFLVGIALLCTGATVGVLSGGSPVRPAVRQLGIGYGAAAVTYVLGLAFGATLG
jgi:VIT1/CCC1 family predicted Fe2+/Mn2+ transporter